MSRIALAAVLALAACGGATTAAHPPAPTPEVGASAGGGNLSVTVGRQFRLIPGQAAMIGGASAGVLFRGVTSDSRCPTGTQCVQAGNAVAAFDVTTAGATTTVSLNTTDGAKEAPLGSYRLQLIGLEPAPAPGAPPAASAYVATVCVCR